METDYQGPMDHIMAFSEYYQWTRGQQTYLVAILVITWTFAATYVEYIENPVNTFLTNSKGRTEQLEAIREYLSIRGLYGNYRAVFMRRNPTSASADFI